jgi:hypothetical protein
VKLAETCVQADIELLDGNLSLNFSTSSSDDLLERLAQHSPVESDFRRAILLGSMGELREAIRIVKERLITLKKQGGDIILVVRAW